MVDTSQTANSRYKFDMLHTFLSESQRGLVENTARVAGFLLIVAGWIATSDSAQKYFSAHHPSIYVTAAALGASFLLYVIASLTIYRYSSHVFSLMKQLNFLPPEYYEVRRVTRLLLVICTVGTSCLAVFTIWLILTVGK